MRSLESKVSRLRDKVSAAVQGKPAPGADLAEALESGVEALVRAAAAAAAEDAGTAWAADPAGRQLLAGDDLRHSSPGLTDATARAVREWQAGVLDLVRSQAAGKRASARFLALGVNGLGLMVMIVVFAHTAGLSGGEIVVAGGATAVSQKVLEAVLGDQAVRTLAEQARRDLQARVAALLDGERRRFSDRLDAAGVLDGAGAALRDAVVLVEAAQ